MVTPWYDEIGNRPALELTDEERARVSERRPVPAPPADRVPTERAKGCRYCDRYRRACGRHDG